MRKAETEEAKWIHLLRQCIIASSVAGSMTTNTHGNGCQSEPIPMDGLTMAVLACGGHIVFPS